MVISKFVNFITFFFLITFLLISHHLLANDLSEREIKQAKQYYSRMSVIHKEDILEVLGNYPIYTNIKFRISSTSDFILDKMFIDLEYTGQVGKTYANSPYIITKQGDHYRARIRDIVDGTVHLIKKDKRKNNYVYLVKGFYDSFITLRGKMIVDIRYDIHSNYVAFDIKAYVIIDNTHMWRLARYVKSLPTFKAKIDRLIYLNVRATIRLGMRTVKGIKKDLKSKRF